MVSGIKEEDPEPAGAGAGSANVRAGTFNPKGWWEKMGPPALPMLNKFHFFRFEERTFYSRSGPVLGSS